MKLRGGKVMFRKRERYCSECICATYHNSECILACGYTCKLNPFKPITMGIVGRCSDRKRNKE